MIDAATFRIYLPEFTSTVTYPDSAVNFWLGVANVMLPTQTWGLGNPVSVSPPTTPLDIGTALFAAHNLVLEARNARAAAAGGVPGGGAGGPVSSESVGGVSRSYDTTAALNLDAGPWNLTNYGTRFIFMARLAGKGPLQIGAGGGCGPSPWFGPPVGPNGFW